MRILLDENFPLDFARLLAGHEVSTVHSLGWSGVKNGELLRRAKDVCDVFVTLDRNLEFQQNIKVLPFGVVVVQSVSNRMAHLTALVSSILVAAGRVIPGSLERVGAQR
jgi:predicted nuclease of predicted toxin-antitoxin system